MTVERQRAKPSKPFTSDELTRLARTVRKTHVVLGPLDPIDPAVSPFPMDLLPHSVFGFDRTGAMVAANVHAKQMLSDGDALSFAQDTVIEVATGQILSLRRGAFVLTRKGAGPLEGNARHTADGVVVEVRDPTDADELEPRILSTLHRLTATEAQVARLLHKGLEPKNVAEVLGVRLTTIRSHIKSILQKLDARDLVELARRLELSLARAIGALPSDRSRKLP